MTDVKMLPWCAFILHFPNRFQKVIISQKENAYHVLIDQINQHIDHS